MCVKNTTFNGCGYTNYTTWVALSLFLSSFIPISLPECYTTSNTSSVRIPIFSPLYYFIDIYVGVEPMTSRSPLGNSLSLSLSLTLKFFS